ncbi:hypothetical protein [Microbacterium thalassium]|uniref:Putative membrane protein YjdF n=1 Tax=Microbacterium thalassium TaxID=362649 RepID=A0A7X0KTT6_9MICO|nr:hypothetical protein [Microbacterium thalassium]MBB6390393.1 putative membrane protein YjdF [Microbacterium thalassium]
MTRADASRTVPSAEHLRRSALRALPFQLGYLVIAAALGFAGAVIHPLLVTLLVVALWAPTLAELIFRTTLPVVLQLHYMVFLTAGAFAGSGLDLYRAIPDWDTVVHADSGVLLAWLGLLFVRRTEERTGALSPRWFALTVTALTPLAFATLWEICEYASDALVGTTSQGGLQDTMTDILAGTLGGLATVAFVMVVPRPRSVVPPSLERARAA